jgi:hypothetical protein
MKAIVQIGVSLFQSYPPITRRLFLLEETSFFELHHIIQISMGWKNYHLFEFTVNGYRIGMVDESEYGFWNNQVISAKSLSLSDVVSSDQDSFEYLYDFGDRWIHNITIERWGEVDDNGFLAHCIDGALNCPPEDCGGINGYYELLEILENKNHPEYSNTLHWVGANFDPKKFDKPRVKRQLEQLQKYIAKWNASN